MLRAFSTAAEPALSDASLGGYHSGYHRLIATPHCAMAHLASVSPAAAKVLAASGYQKECSIATARSNCCCAGALHDVAKCACPTCAPAPSACAGALSAAASAATEAVSVSLDCERIPLLIASSTRKYSDSASVAPLSARLGDRRHTWERRGRGLNGRTRHLLAREPACPIRQFGVRRPPSHAE